MEEDIYAFLEAYGFLGVLPAVLFTFGTILGLLSFLPIIYIISSAAVFYTSVICVGIVALLCVWLFESIKRFYWDKAKKHIEKSKTIHLDNPSPYNLDV